MKLTIFAAALVTVTACVDEVDTNEDVAEIWTDLDRNNLRHPLRIKSTINTGGTGMCMDVAGGYTAVNTPIVQYPCHTGMNQQFYLYNLGPSAHQIRSRLDTRMCVGIRSNNELALLVCDTPTGAAAPTTRWIFDSTTGQNTTAYVRFRSSASTCIDVPGGSNGHSLILQAYQCHAGPNQVWAVTNL